MRRLTLFAVLFFAFGQPAFSSQEEIWAALKTPGTIAIMRHALAPGTGDPEEFRVGDCSTQRNLNEAGREQARAIGAAIREQGVTFDTILSSQWCRCRETAALLDLGEVRDYPVLNSFYQDWGSADSQTAALREYLRTGAAGGKSLLVTHQVNISALTANYTRSGEILVIRVKDSGEVETLGSIYLSP